jgi:hypothetical protein
MNKKRNDLKNILPGLLLMLAVFISVGVAHAGVQSTATFVNSDTVSQGNWQSRYGSDGFSIANGPQSLPAYASFTPQSALSWTWAAGTGDARALQSSAGRLASTWYSGSSFSVDVNLTDGQQHAVELYAVDFDYRGRSETIQLLDANTGAVLDTRSISNFTSGIYIGWSVTGHVTVQVTCNGGANAVVSGIFFGGTQASGSTNAAAVASFVNSDSSTQGNWQGKYGTDGFSLAASASSVPGYASFSVLNNECWTWVSATSDPRGLQSTYGYATAATWYNSPTFNFDVNMTDGKSHSFAIYAVDWDSRGRAETVQILDANSGAVLDTRSLANFYNGVYLVWNIAGHVTINVTATAGANAVVSGVFFAPTVASNPVSTSSSAPTIGTQPVSKTVSAGQTATFMVASSGTAPLAYQWMKNGVAISGATSSSYTTPAAAMSDNGSQFAVMVSNGAGSVTSSAATLTVTGTYVLTLSSNSINFGSVNVSSASQLPLMLTNAGTANVTVSNVSVSGAGFNASGVSSGTILAPGQSVAITAVFNPASTGTATGSISIASNATSGTQVVALYGTGAAASHSVSLIWTPSTSSVVGYNVYVSTVSGSNYAKLTSSPVPSSNFTDSGLQTAQTRYYVVTSVDANNNESGFSNQVTAVVP